METSISQFGAWNILAIDGEFVVKYLSAIRQHLDSFMSTPNPFIAFDLSKASYIDSSAITLMLNFQKRIEAAAGRIVIFGATEDARAIFSIVGLDASITLYDTREEFEKAVA